MEVARVPGSDRRTVLSWQTTPLPRLINTCTAGGNETMRDSCVRFSRGHADEPLELWEMQPRSCQLRKGEVTAGG